MPDWSYRTVFRPVFFQLPVEFARDFSLGFMGKLARLPLGPSLIGFLGHMRPDSSLSSTHAGIDFPSRVGLGVGIDANGLAFPALAKFGFGFLEIGPVSLEPRGVSSSIERLANLEAIRYADAAANLGMKHLQPRIAEAARTGLPIIVRITAEEDCSAAQASEQCASIMAHLADHVSAFSLLTMAYAMRDKWSTDEWKSHLDSVARAAKKLHKKWLLCAPAELTQQELDDYVLPAVAAGCDGFVVEGGLRDAKRGRLAGKPAREAVLATVALLRANVDERLIIAGGGVHEPEQALALLEAGANLVQIDTGLVYSGPGLPKRVNEATRYALQSSPVELEATDIEQAARQSWFWTLLMGIGMFGGGLLALAIAATRVVLPYDETFVGMTRDELHAVNPYLLDFLTHDRVTVAGTMISIGILYCLFSLYGIRRGLHWAKVAVLSSAFAGFATFFLFLGFGYFDPFHAFVTAILFQFLLLGLHSRLPPRVDSVGPDLQEDWQWRSSQWGQLAYIIHGAILITAGTVISYVGITKVFVPEDLMFMHTTAAEITAASPRLLPLIAHDRATFGGMLISIGITVLLASLWGFRRGAKWLWWALFLAGLAGYVPTIIVHVAVGYTHLGHLAPAFGGIFLLLLGSAWSYPYLCGVDEEHHTKWSRHLTAAKSWR